MRVLAYTDARYAAATRQVVGGEALLLVSPPTYAWNFDPAILADRDLIYLDLHGKPHSVYLYSGVGQGEAALSVANVRAARLGGAVVFATTCYLPQTPFVRAFLDAGASVMIGGDGKNYGARTRLSGAQALARALLKFLARGDAPEQALARAQRALRANVRLRLFDAAATEDALGFRAFQRKDMAA